MHEAMYWNKGENNNVICSLCPHNCNIPVDRTGICRVRKNIDGILYSMNYGKITAIAMDPIEKKPLKNYFPGNSVLSIGSFGCNLRCSFCQNWSIAHETPPVKNIELRSMIEIMETYDSCIGIAYTYNEPSIWYEYILHTAHKIKEIGYKNILVTNGYINVEPLKKLIPYIDAVNIDVKGFTQNYYNRICGGNLDNVKQTVEIITKSCHVEVTTLLVPELNDSAQEINGLSAWLAKINPDIPLHLTRYFPNYKMRNSEPTSLETMNRARDEAKKYLNNVYLGNV
jgi:pyruvate formate lyase activating enzyme